MKRNKFKEFLNSRGQYAAVFAFIVVAGICAGAAALNGPQEETAIETEQMPQSVAQSDTTVTEPVLTNKNAQPENQHKRQHIRKYRCGSRHKLTA